MTPVLQLCALYSNVAFNAQYFFKGSSVKKCLVALVTCQRTLLETETDCYLNGIISNLLHFVTINVIKV